MQLTSKTTISCGSAAPTCGKALPFRVDHLLLFPRSYASRARQFSEAQPRKDANYLIPISILRDLITIYAIPLILGILITGLLMSGTMFSEDVTSPVKLTLSTTRGVRYTQKRIPLKVTFKNVSDSEIKLLNTFDEADLIRIFFSFNLTKADGTPVILPGGGKVDFASEGMKYVELKKGATFNVNVDLASILPVGTEIPPGEYTASVKYFNQYGQGCFQGRVSSNFVHFNLEEDQRN